MAELFEDYGLKYWQKITPYTHTHMWRVEVVANNLEMLEEKHRLYIQYRYQTNRFGRRVLTKGQIQDGDPGSSS
jgi:hypothetical protein